MPTRLTLLELFGESALRKVMNLDDTIVAVSSPRGNAPRGIVRLSGGRAVEIAGQVFVCAIGEALAGVCDNRCVDGKVSVAAWRLPASCYVFWSPASYTREDIVELHMLGASGVLAEVMEACLAAGARSAEPGEFTARAFLSGAMDLSQAHGVAGMIAARSDHQLQAAERLLHGALSETARRARDELAELLSLVEGALDFADEPIEFIGSAELHARLVSVYDALAATSAAGLRAERWGQLPHVVLVGRTNVGKSALLNRLTGLDRAICAPVAGTTRDVLSAPLVLEDLECLLIDIPGSSRGATGVAAEAQAAGRRAANGADVVLQVEDLFEGSAFGDDGCAGLVRSDVPRILVANKCDLVPRHQWERTVAKWRTASGCVVCPTSAKTGEGCDALKAAISRVVSDRPVDIHDASIALMAEHRAALDRSIEATSRAIALAAACSESLADADLVAVELRTAADALGTLAGQEDTEALLGRIFSRFCVGK
ncbi:MAG: GTPase [Planctomycetota bacterium]